MDDSDDVIKYVEVESYAMWICPSCDYKNYRSAGSVDQYDWLSCGNCDGWFKAANEA